MVYRRADIYPVASRRDTLLLRYGAIGTDGEDHRFLKIIPATIQDMIDQTDLPILNAELGAKSETELDFVFSTVFGNPSTMTARMDSL